MLLEACPPRGSIRAWQGLRGPLDWTPGVQSVEHLIVNRKALIRVANQNASGGAGAGAAQTSTQKVQHKGPGTLHPGTMNGSIMKGGPGPGPVSRGLQISATMTATTTRTIAVKRYGSSNVNSTREALMTYSAIKNLKRLFSQHGPSIDANMRELQKRRPTLDDSERIGFGEDSQRMPLAATPSPSSQSPPLELPS